MTKPMMDFVLEVLHNYGPYGLGFIFMMLLVWYQERKHSTDRKQFREDFNNQHETHRSDRNEWVGTMKDQNNKMISAFKENSEALKSNAVATKELSIHIQNCQK